MEKAIQNTNDKIKSYQEMMRTIGVLGITLPILVISFNWIAEIVNNIPQHERIGVLTSISKYYYSFSRNIFVGVLSILAVILYTYTGDRKAHDRWASVAGASSIGIAIFPCDHELLKNLHFISAFLLFGTFSIFCLKFFRETDQHDIAVPSANRKFYMYCGLAIIAGLVTCLIAFIATRKEVEESPVIFFAEAIMLLAFGLSWIRKAEESKPYLSLLLGRRENNNSESA